MTANLPTIPELVEAKLRGIPPEGWVDMRGYLFTGQFGIQGTGDLIIDVIVGQRVTPARFIFGFSGPGTRIQLQFCAAADYARVRSMHGLQIEWFILHGEHQHSFAGGSDLVAACEELVITQTVPERVRRIPTYGNPLGR